MMSGGRLIAASNSAARPSGPPFRQPSAQSPAVLPGCGGATTTNPWLASTAVKKVDCHGTPPLPCENITIGYGPWARFGAASTVPASLASTLPVVAAGYQITVLRTRSCPLVEDGRII